MYYAGQFSVCVLVNNAVVVRLCQVKFDRVRSDCHVMLSYVTSGQVILGEVRLGQVILRQVILR